MSRKIKTLIVDDSAVVRQALTQILSSDSDIVVIGAASDPFAAAEKMREETPDVIVLDIEMPRMDGLTFLEKIMRQHPIPIVMCSSLTDSGCGTAVQALEKGAVSLITKPKIGVRSFLEESKITICDTVKAAACVKLHKMTCTKVIPEQKLSADVILARPHGHAMIRTTEKIVAIGASTGGTQALKEVLMGLPADAPGIVIVQHMPEKFTAAFAASLDRDCRINVKEARSDDTVTRGTALIAAGNHHMLLKRSGARYFVEVRDGPLVSRHRPSVDVLFRSVARYAGANAVGIILTGMGDDGASGLQEMREAGARTVAQDEESCVVFGMPGEAVRRGAAEKVLPLSGIASEMLHLTA